jgi:hypothetical protein
LFYKRYFSFCHKFSLQGSGWKVVASFEGNFPNRIKQLPLDRHFDINNVKRVESLSYFTCLLPLFFPQLIMLSGALLLIWHFSTLLDCPRSRRLSTLSYISRERVEVLNKRCPRTGKGTISSMC